MQVERHIAVHLQTIWGSFELISVRLERTKETQFKPQHQADIAILELVRRFPGNSATACCTIAKSGLEEFFGLLPHGAARPCSARILVANW